MLMYVCMFPRQGSSAVFTNQKILPMLADIDFPARSGVLSVQQKHNKRTRRAKSVQKKGDKLKLEIPHLYTSDSFRVPTNHIPLTQ